MTRKSPARLHREYDFSNISERYVMPEDIPVLLRKTAEEICGAFYEDERSPIFRARWRNQKVYVKLNWASFLPAARTVLTSMLDREDVSITQKEEIYAAFVQQAEKRAMMDFSEHLAPGAVQ